VGTANITATSATYAVSGSTELTVKKKDQTITFGTLVGKTYGDPDFTVSATASSALAVTFTASGSCTVSGSTVHITGAGSCTITAHQGGNNTYNPAPDVPQTFMVAKATPTVTVTDPMPTYDGNPHSATATAVGVDGHTAVSGSFTFTYDGSGTAPTNAKTSYAVVATFTSSDSNYAGATGNGVLTIKQRPATVTAENKGKSYGDDNPAL